MKNKEKKQYPTLRYVSERLKILSSRLRSDFYFSNKLSHSEKYAIGCMLLELLSHSCTLSHYASQIPIEECNYPRTIDDYLDLSDFPF